MTEYKPNSMAAAMQIIRDQQEAGTGIKRVSQYNRVVYTPANGVEQEFNKFAKHDGDKRIIIQLAMRKVFNALTFPDNFSEQEKLFAVQYGLANKNGVVEEMDSAIKAQKILGARHLEETGDDSGVFTTRKSGIGFVRALEQVGLWEKDRKTKDGWTYTRTGYAMWVLYETETALRKKEYKLRKRDSDLVGSSLCYLNAQAWGVDRELVEIILAGASTNKFDKELLPRSMEWNEKKGKFEYGKPLSVTKFLNMLVAIEDTEGGIWYDHNTSQVGRVSIWGTLAGYQGNKIFREVLVQRNSQRVTKRGKLAILCAIADEIGCKRSLVQRCKAAKKWLAGAELTPELAIRQPMLAKYLKAWQDVEATGGTRHLIYQDATSSGLQHYAGFCGDYNLAEATNCTPANIWSQVADAYGPITALTGDRDIAKKLLMPWLYGGSRRMLVSLLKEIYRTEDMELHEQCIFEGKDFTAPVRRDAEDVVGEFWDAAKRAYPAVHRMKAYLYKLCETYHAEGGQGFTWVRPDGMKVHIEKFDMSAISVRCGSLHTYYEGVDAPYSDAMTASALMPSIIHSLDALMLHKVVRYLGDKGVFVAPIHDSFGVTPDAYFAIKKVLGHAYASTHEQIRGQSLLREIFKDEIFFERGEWNVQEAANAFNMFC